MRLSAITIVFLCSSTLAAPSPSLYSASSSSCRCGIVRSSSSNRIVGGRETDPQDLPWQAALMWRGHGWAGCGATVIGRRLVLTAAHCTSGKTADRLAVMVRSDRVFNPDAESLRFDVTEIIQHSGYSEVHNGNDFSLLRLSEPIEFPADGSIAPACLPAPGDTYLSANATVSGYGMLSWKGELSVTLRSAHVSVISNAACERAYPGSIKDSMLCADGAGERDACQGDSGGPLVAERNGRFSLIGVVSWGKECAEPDYPGVYARVTEALDWIRENASDDDFCD
ncbi:trypsin-1-like [Amphibalanus amphitrite]|uniref:trypsin-1-like n=1 Tax=Amphibalanus amphitrite TaxID=1232801 RepID=UPI001C921331|nr:trypsin-1-like [Amphibalanus amphitrite]